jgi:hypothetical protein
VRGVVLRAVGKLGAGGTGSSLSPAKAVRVLGSRSLTLGGWFPTSMAAAASELLAAAKGRDGMSSGRQGLHETIELVS